jgi:hypothetical protein
MRPQGAAPGQPCEGQIPLIHLKACKPDPDPLREIRGIARFLSAFID